MKENYTQNFVTIRTSLLWLNGASYTKVTIDSL